MADSSTLITLLDMDNISLLFELFEEMIISDEVYSELTQKFYHKEKIDACLVPRKLKL